MASSFIGKSISLISHSDIRYRGTLQGIDAQASTIQLENVYYMGTETRRPPEDYVAPKPEPFAYIVFRASEVKDLAVDDSVPPLATSVHDDPAVLGASPPVAPNYPPYSNQQNQQVHPVRQPQSIQTASSLVPVPAPPAIRDAVQNRNQPSRPQQPQHQGGNRSRANPVSSANAAVEQVERAMSDLRVNGSGPINSYRGGRGGRRGRGGRISDGGDQIRVPTTDFDFESANAKFDKTAVGKAAKTPDEDNTSDDSIDQVEPPPKVAYNPKASFFDTISSSASTPGDRGPGGARGRRGGGAVNGGRTRRDEEREKNFVTFGETGGAGLLGRGDHIVGWNAYGRRGGRPRRGTPRGGANVQAAAARG